MDIRYPRWEIKERKQIQQINGVIVIRLDRTKPNRKESSEIESIEARIAEIEARITEKEAWDIHLKSVGQQTIVKIPFLTQPHKHKMSNNSTYSHPSHKIQKIYDYDKSLSTFYFIHYFLLYPY